MVRRAKRILHDVAPECQRDRGPEVTELGDELDPEFLAVLDAIGDEPEETRADFARGVAITARQLAQQARSRRAARQHMLVAVAAEMEAEPAYVDGIDVRFVPEAPARPVLRLVQRARPRAPRRPARSTRSSATRRSSTKALASGSDPPADGPEPPRRAGRERDGGPDA